MLTGLFLSMAVYIIGLANGYYKDLFIDTQPFKICANNLIEMTYYLAETNELSIQDYLNSNSGIYIYYVSDKE